MKSRVIVLIFHEIRESELVKFKRIVQFIERFFKFITPVEFEDYLMGKTSLKGVNFLITFDDGFISSKDAINKVLDPLGVKSVLFICSGYVEKEENEIPNFIKNNFFFKPEESYVIPERWPIRKDGLIELHLTGHRIGAHSISHTVLSKVTGRNLELEITEVKSYLSECLGEEVDWFAYPFGGVSFINSESMKLIKDNYHLNFTGIRGEVQTNQDFHCIPRCPVDISASFMSQLSEVVGVTNAFHRAKIRKILEYKNSAYE